MYLYPESCKTSADVETVVSVPFTNDFSWLFDKVSLNTDTWKNPTFSGHDKVVSYLDLHVILASRIIAE